MQDRVWLYLVVSSDAQEESLPAQRRWGFDEAARIGATVDPKGVFEGVASGKHGARTILIDLIAKLSALPKTQRPSRVLMVRLDRTGRMPFDAISAINDIRKLGVIIRTRKDGDLTFARMIDMVGPMFDLMRAGFDNEVRSDMSRAGHKRRRDEGKLVPAKPPYGVMRDERGFPVADPQCAPIVREVFARWIAGQSPSEIVKWLRATAPPRIGKRGREIRLDWSLSHVYKMVHLGTYRGVVIDDDTFERAQRRKKPASKPGRGGYVYPFSGIKCSCGHTLRARTNVFASRYKRKDGSEVVYRRAPIVWYVCQSLKHKGGPKYRSFREERIEEVWLAALRALKLDRGPFAVKAKSTNYAPRIEMLTRRLDVLNGRRERIHVAFEEGAYDAKTMQERLSAVERDETALLEEIEQIKSAYETEREQRIERDRVAKLLRDAERLYKRGTREERAALNRAIFAAFGTPTIDDRYRMTF
jgi:DNA invertase Pin-like site-specific DNA recombinase